MSRDYRQYLDNINASCQKIIRYIGEITMDQFLQDDRTYDAVIRNLEIIGEASKNIPDEIRNKYPNVEWR